jgi:predicted dehydrogenase
VPGETRTIRLGVIGTGTFAEICHLPGLRSHPAADLVAICGRRGDRAQLLANRFGIPNVYTDYEELCARPDIDAVTIVTPNVHHATQALCAFASGKHVFCEKPLALTVAEAREMVRAAEASGKVHQVSFTFRYLYAVRELRRRVVRGDIGVPHYLRAQFDSWDGLRATCEIGFRDKLELAGGGMLYDVGSHLFDLARFMFGSIETATGFSHLIRRQRTDRYTGALADVETDDLAAAWFVHDCGVRGQWFASRATPPSVDRSYLEVIGHEGALHASLSRGTVESLLVSTPATPAWSEVPLPEGAHDQSPHCLGIMMRSFVDACLRGRLDAEVDASFHDGLAAQQGLAAIATATTRPAWVQLKDMV